MHEPHAAANWAVAEALSLRTALGRLDVYAPPGAPLPALALAHVLVEPLAPSRPIDSDRLVDLLRTLYGCDEQ